MTFIQLSEAARKAIVDAVMGIPVPPLSDAVKAEIKAWAETDESAPVHVDNPVDTTI